MPRDEEHGDHDEREREGVDQQGDGRRACRPARRRRRASTATPASMSALSTTSWMRSSVSAASGLVHDREDVARAEPAEQHPDDLQQRRDVRGEDEPPLQATVSRPVGNAR